MKCTLFQKQVAYWLLGITAMEFLSRVVVFHPLWNSVVAILFALIVAYLMWVRPTAAMGIISVEYLIGSKGALFHVGSDPLNHGGVSVRILFFVACLLVWFVRSMGKTRQVMAKEGTHWWIQDLPVVYLALAALWLLAVARGAWFHQPFLSTDAQPWLAWLLLLPMLDVAMTSPIDQIKQDWWPAIAAGLIWLPLETLGLFYLFSHQVSVYLIQGTYLWVRHTGVAEITHASAGLWRIFLQSQVYALALIAGVWAWWLTGHRLERWTWLLGTLSVIELILSLSRSFWIGVVVGCVVMVVVARKMITRTSLMTTTKNSLIILVSAFALILATLWFPFPRSGGGDLTGLISSRVDTEDQAATSRWSLLPAMLKVIERHPIWGSGFGATVSYQSYDPRAVQQTISGSYTTHAFEWGWLTFWLQFGLFGPMIVAWLLIDITTRVWGSKLSPWIRVAIIGSLIGLAVLHVLTPYLNHPLGIFLMMMVEVSLVFAQRDSGELLSV